MTLKSLKTDNFYAVVSKKIVFDPHVTTIVGKSAIGKSSFIRSLKWTALNKPSGIRFIRWGQKRAATLLKIKKQPDIHRSRSKSDNVYQLGSKDFRSFKNEVPKEISDILNVGEINFQSQHSPHFWFSLTSGEVAREFNKIINLEVIDISSSKIASKVRDCEAKLSVVVERLTDLRQERERLRWVKTADKKLRTVEKLQKRLSQKRPALASLLEKICDIKKIDSEMNMYRSISKKGKEFLTMKTTLDDAMNKSARLELILSEIGDCQRVINVKIPDITKLEDAMKKSTYEKKRLKTLTDLTESIKIQEETRIEWESLKKKAQKKLKKEMNGRCPICRKTIK